MTPALYNETLERFLDDCEMEAEKLDLELDRNDPWLVEAFQLDLTVRQAVRECQE